MCLLVVSELSLVALDPESKTPERQLCYAAVRKASHAVCAAAHASLADWLVGKQAADA
jgi:hypothetical protein